MPFFKVSSIPKIVFSTVVEVRISDINYGNHLGHDSLVSLLHEARMRFLKTLGYTELDILGSGLIMTSLLVNYINEAFYYEKLIIQIGIGDMTRTSVNFIYQVINEKTSKEIARALTTMTFYDYQNKKVSKIPQQFLGSISILSNQDAPNSKVTQ